MIPTNMNLSDEEYQSLAKSLGRTSAISIIAAAVSMFFGGVILSGFSVIVAGVAFYGARRIVKSTNMEKASPAFTNDYLRAYSRLKATLLAAVLALALNVASLAYIWPRVQDYLETGDSSTLNGILGENASEGSSDSSGFWGSGSGSGNQPSSGSSFW